MEPQLLNMHYAYKIPTLAFLANVNSRSRSLFAVARPSVVCLSVVGNTRAPYSAGWNFPQYFYSIWYLGHPLTSTENLNHGDRPMEPSAGGVKQRGVAKCSDF